MVAFNCSPCSRSLIQHPFATSHSPAVTEGSDPTTNTGRSVRSAILRRYVALLFANGEARRFSVPAEKPAPKWAVPETPFGIVPD
jgi:hypothetical protein